MRGLIRRAALAAGAVLVLVGVSTASAAAAAGPAVLGFEPASHEFGPVALGQHRDLTLSLANSGGRASSQLTVGLSGSTAYALTADECSGRTLGPRKNCTVTVRFAPTADSAANATVTVTGKHRVAPANATLTGRGGGFGSGVPEHLYWIGLDPGAGAYSVNSSPLTANPLTVTPVVDLTPPTGANYLTVDQTNVYWSDDLNINGTINSSRLAGGPVTTLASGQDSPQGVAVAGGYLYWTTNGDGGVKRLSLADGSVTTLRDYQQGNLSGIAVDSVNLYWATYTGGPAGGAIMYAPLTTQGIGRPQVLIDGLDWPTGLAVGNGQVYWTDSQDNTVNAITVSNRGGTVIASDQNQPLGVAVNGGQAYWASGNGTINTAPVNGAGLVTNLYDSLSLYPKAVAIGP